MAYQWVTVASSTFPLGEVSRHSVPNTHQGVDEANSLRSESWPSSTLQSSS
jgi:hypothetical protein